MIWFAILLVAWLPPVTASAQMARDVTMQSSWNVAQLRSSVPPDGANLAREGDALILRYRGSASAVTVCCGLQLPLHPLGESDVWVLKVSVPDLDRAVLSPDLMIETPTGNEWLALDDREW